MNSLATAPAKTGRAIKPGRLPGNPALALWSTPIGKKVVMAVTGGILVLFVIVHMIGNLKMFAGAETIDAYARFLREVAQPELGYSGLLWIVRIILLVSVVLHIVAAAQLNRMNRLARPVGYEVKKNIATSYAAVLMGWGGVLLAIFIVFHILHFTLGAVGFKPGQYEDLQVYHNMIIAFHVWWIFAFYMVSMVALCFHLDHGIWSMLHTLGWNTRKNRRTLRALSRLIAVVVFLGFISAPIAVMAGWLH
jgi:succinate dehydrogenase / fumarate reductase cytochrome b subunit